MDKNQEKQAKEYQKIRQKLTLFNLVWTPALLWLVIGTGISVKLYEMSASVSNPYGILTIYFLFFSLVLLVFDLPLSYYSGFALEHRFHLSNQTLGAWIKETLKKSVLSFLLSLLLLLALYALIWNSRTHWWLYAWVAYAGVSYVMGKLFPVFIVPIFYKYGPVENASLKERILGMAKKHGMPVENVYSLNLSKTTKKANAAFMGLGKTKRVVLSDTLLSNFSSEEIETVVAHELGHFKHKDIWKQLGFGLISSLAAFWIAYRCMPSFSASLGFSGVEDIRSLPLLFLIFYFFSLILMPLQNGFSRWMERLADLFSLEAYP